MRKIIIPVVLILLYLIFLLQFQVQIYPEFFVYPHFVSSGLLPYRDFFDHHGFLTHFLLAPISGNYQAIQYIFIFLEVVQLYIIYELVEKRIKRSWFTVAFVLLYAAFRFSVVQHIMWFDTWISFFVLFAWLFFEQKKENAGWISLFLAACIKPTALLLSVPFFLRSKKKKQGLLIFLVGFFLVTVFFISQQGIADLYAQLVLFNQHYVQTTYRTMFFGIGIKYSILLLGFFVTTIVFFLRSNRKNHALFFLTCLTLSFFFQGLAKQNLALFTCFYIILLSDVIASTKQKKPVLFFVFIFMMFIFRDTYKTAQSLLQRKPYVNKKLLSEMKEIKKTISFLKTDNIFVLGNRPEFYYYLSARPITQFVLYYPWIQEYFQNMQKEMKTKLQEKKPMFVVIPKKMNEYENFYLAFVPFVIRNYSVFRITDSYTIWHYNNKN